MVYVDLRALGPYRPIFTSWFVPALLLANFIYLRRKASVSFLKLLGVDFAMTALAWLLVDRVPVVPFVVTQLLLGPIGYGIDNAPIVAAVPVLALTALIVTISQAALLRRLSYAVSRKDLELLAGINLLCPALASYRMLTLAMDHRPLA